METMPQLPAVDWDKPPEPPEQYRRQITGSGSGYLSSGRMRPPNTRAQRKAYYREAVRLTRSPGIRRRKFRRIVRGTFKRYGGMMSRLAAEIPDAPYTFVLASGAKVTGKGLSVAFNARGAEVWVGAAATTWPVS